MPRSPTPHRARWRKGRICRPPQSGCPTAIASYLGAHVHRAMRCGRGTTHHRQAMRELRDTQLSEPHHTTPHHSRRAATLLRCKLGGTAPRSAHRLVTAPSKCLCVSLPLRPLTSYRTVADKSSRKASAPPTTYRYSCTGRMLAVGKQLDQYRYCRIVL